MEATKFTEIGYVGRDVEQIIRDLVEISLKMVRERQKNVVKSKAEANAEERVLNALVGETSTSETRAKFRKMLIEGQLNDKEIDIEVAENATTSMPAIDIPGMPGAQMGMLNLGDLLGKSFGPKLKTRKLKVKDALEPC